MDEQDNKWKGRTYKIQWTQNQKIVVCGLFLIEKTFQEIARLKKHEIERIVLDFLGGLYEVT